MITLTEAAARKLREVLEQKGLAETHALRVFVTGGGCGGMQYGMTFDNKPREDDEVFEQHGLRILVDPISSFYISGSRIDYVDSLMGGGFHIENPNAVSTCGCGSSFRTSKTHTGEEPAPCGHY
ncbi:MAG: iron-sulfur cluster insertion protein ErpA [Anaerolineae bacterium]|nr:iron-sulfur cluster insertion protein ErpA [Anaerolineae bacterium]MDW8098406.1 iron-sulfur cluster insertion protein ErpA [Anaerolineae bacterium]